MASVCEDDVEAQAAKVHELKSRLFSNSTSSLECNIKQEQLEWCDDACLRRYLRARNWNVKKSAKMLKETLKWRWHVKPHLITDEDVKSQSWAGSSYVHGYDKELHPTIIMRAALDPPGLADVKLKFLLHTMEDALRAMAAGVEKWAVIVDLKGFSVKQHGDLKVTVNYLKVMQSHYPERLARFVIVNTPKAFINFWRVISAVVDNATKEKFVVIGEDGIESFRDFFLKLYDENQLENTFGGTLLPKTLPDVQQRLLCARGISHESKLVSRRRSIDTELAASSNSTRSSLSTQSSDLQHPPVS